MTAVEPFDQTGDLVDELRRRGMTVAIAESLTGGLLVAEFIRIPGASRVVRGGVVAYATDLKNSLLGVDAEILTTRGPVDPDVAAQMADGVRRRLGSEGEAATWGLSTTGVAGPGPQDGHPAGTVFVGVADEKGMRSHRLTLTGDRESVRRQTVTAAVELLRNAVAAPIRLRDRPE
jgi:nicotinamide-nucleotide amidase